MALARVLVMAGSDSGGGAGIQADLLTVAALGGHACTVVTAITAQDSLGVRGVWPVEEAALRAQFLAVSQDIGQDAVKTGMIPNARLVEAAAELLSPLAVPVVVDPVLTSTSGHDLLEPRALAAFKRLMVPLAGLITPNLAEARALTGLEVGTVEDMARAAKTLVEMGARAALVKGGHLGGDPRDVLWDGRELRWFAAPRLHNPHCHGTGCTLASAIATLLAQGRELATAVESGRALVRRAIAAGTPLGRGRGPVRPLAGLGPWA